MLIADRDSGHCQQLAEETLRQRTIRIKRVSTLEMALRWSEQMKPSAVVLDLEIDSLPKALCAITRLARGSAVMATVCGPSVSLVVAALKAGAQDFCEKPCGTESIALWALGIACPCPHVLAERLDHRLREYCGNAGLTLTTFSGRIRF